MQAKLHHERDLVAAMQRLHKLSLVQAFDPVNPASRPTVAQQEIMNDIEKVKHRYIIAGNQSGKSSIPSKEISWIVTDTHPSWTRPARWGDEPLLIIVAGQDRKMMEIEIWSKKIKPFLPADEWREIRVGGSLTFVEHRRHGHKIVFVSHNDSSDKNRQHMQGYVAHYVWLDEMPRDIKILEELTRRVDARNGYLIVTFTPKIKNEEIRRVVDSLQAPLAKKYQLSKLDNPLYADRRDEELQKLAGYSESYRNTILYGEWFQGDSAVYEFTDEMIAPLVPFYHKAWRHVLSVDPALKSKFGFTLWAEDPGEGIWYLVKDEYIENIFSPDDILTEVIKRCQGYNIINRISDPHESWFIGLAGKFRITYQLADKTDKGRLIKNLQLQLSSGKIRIAAWCSTFITEIQSCQWSESDSDRIINGSRYHTLDCAQYFADNIPSYNEMNRVQPWYTELRQKNEQRKKKNKTRARLQEKRQKRWGVYR